MNSIHSSPSIPSRIEGRRNYPIVSKPIQSDELSSSVCTPRADRELDELYRTQQLSNPLMNEGRYDDTSAEIIAALHRGLEKQKTRAIMTTVEPQLVESLSSILLPNHFSADIIERFERNGFRSLEDLRTADEGKIEETIRGLKPIPKKKIEKFILALKEEQVFLTRASPQRVQPIPKGLYDDTSAEITAAFYRGQDRSRFLREPSSPYNIPSSTSSSPDFTLTALSSHSNPTTADRIEMKEDKKMSPLITHESARFMAKGLPLHQTIAEAKDSRNPHQEVFKDFTKIDIQDEGSPIINDIENEGDSACKNHEEGEEDEDYIIVETPHPALFADHRNYASPVDSIPSEERKVVQLDEELKRWCEANHLSDAVLIALTKEKIHTMQQLKLIDSLKVDRIKQQLKPVPAKRWNMAISMILPSR